MTPARTIAEQAEQLRLKLTEWVPQIAEIVDEDVDELITNALTAATAAQEAELPNGADLRVIRQAYDWTYDTETGEIMGLTAGDHGYEGTGIVVSDIAKAEARLTAQEAGIASLREALQQIAHADAENCGCDHKEECCARVGVAGAYCAATAALGASHD